MLSGLIKLFDVAEKLKCNTRHSQTSSGRAESIAEHSWRLAFMALTYRDEMLRYKLDADRVLQMCIIHDIGEAVMGDIPSFVKTSQDEESETAAVKQLFDSCLSVEQAKQWWSVYVEAAEVVTGEARYFKALDKIEAVMQHNQADISSWIEIEYKLNIDYGVKEAAEFEQLNELRQALVKQTRQKIAAAKD